MSLDEAFQRACTTPSDIYRHVGKFAQWAASAEKVIELGTRTGVSTTGWLRGLEVGGGHLWSVDLDEQPSLGFDTGRWTFIQGNDLDPNVVGQLPNDVDIVFIDTSHTYQQTLAELFVYQWKVKTGGLIVLHDTEVRRPLGASLVPAFPVKTAIEEFCNEEGFTWQNSPECFGLGVIQL